MTQKNEAHDSFIHILFLGGFGVFPSNACLVKNVWASRPLLFRLTIPILFFIDVDQLVRALFLFLDKPYGFVWRIWTSFCSSLFCFGFSLSTTCSLILFKSVYIGKFGEFLSCVMKKLLDLPHFLHIAFIPVGIFHKSLIGTLA